MPGARSELVGREDELDTLRACFDDAQQGNGSLVLCVGEAGIGKTRLAEELAGVALAQSASVVWGRSVESKGAPPYWPWRQVLRGLGLPEESLTVRGAEPEDRFLLFDTVVQTIIGSARDQTVVIVLDDLQWIDTASLLLLRHLVDQLRGARLLVLATVRVGERTGPITAALPELQRAPTVVRIDVRGLETADVQRQLTLASGSAVDDDLARSVRDMTAGNPFFIQEVARAISAGTWTGSPPRTVLGAIEERARRLSTDCQRFLRAAAIIGREFPLGLVALVLGEPAEACLAASDEAITHGLVEQTRVHGEHRFTHALVRDAIEAMMPSSDRIALHRAAAGAIESFYAATLDDHLADIARHWSALASVGEGVLAATWAERAADAAVDQLAFEEAVRLYRLALDVGAGEGDAADRCRVRIAMGHALHRAGELVACLGAATEAAAEAVALGRPDLAAEAALLLEATADPELNAAVKVLCEQALAALEDGSYDSLRARLLAQRSHLAFYERDVELTDELSAQALTLARATGDDRALVDALRARHESCPGPAGRVERQDLADELVAVAQRLGSHRTALWGHLWRFDVLVEAGQLRAAEAELVHVRLAVDRVGGPVPRWELERSMATVAQGQARFDEAAAAAARGLAIMRDIEPGPAFGTYSGLLLALSHQVGPHPQVIEQLREPLRSPPMFVTMGRLGRARLWLAVGDREAAESEYERAGPVERWTLPTFYVIPTLATGAIVAIALGHKDDAAALHDRLSAFRGEHTVGGAGAGAYLGPVELYLGIVDAGLGRVEDAITDFTTALAQAEIAGAPAFAAEARYHLAVVLTERNQPRDAEVALDLARAAERAVRTYGMHAFDERVAALVRRLGTTERPSTLSAREDEVARLVAEGMTNRQIADALVISERTAQNHVQHILTKLGFSSRSQIAAWVSRSGR